MKSDKSQVLLEILSSPYKTISTSDDNVLTITGRLKTEVVELTRSEVDLVATLLQHENKTIRFEAIKVLRYFGELVNPYIDDITKNFSDFREKEQKEILRTITSIRSEKSLIELGKLLEQEHSYDLLLEVVFAINFFLKDYPLLATSLLFKEFKNETIRKLLTDFLREAQVKASKIYNPKLKIADLVKTPPPISMSQEGERVRSMFNVLKDNLETALRKINDLEENGTISEKNEAKEILEELDIRLNK